MLRQRPNAKGPRGGGGTDTGAGAAAGHEDLLTRTALVLAGSDLEGLDAVVDLANPTIPPMVRSPFSNTLPDYVVSSPALRARGAGGILMAGSVLSAVPPPMHTRARVCACACGCLGPATRLDLRCTTPPARGDNNPTCARAVQCTEHRRRHASAAPEPLPGPPRRACRFWGNHWEYRADTSFTATCRPTPAPAPAHDVVDTRKDEL